MKDSSKKSIIILSLVSLFFTACNDVKFDEYFNQINSVKNYPVFYSTNTDVIADLCLIYNGRPNPLVEYTTETLKSYVYHTDKNGKINFLFDGFLFLEIVGSNGRSLENNPDLTTKKEWTWYIDQQFKTGFAIPALNELLDSLEEAGSVPMRKRKIVIGIPTPYESKKSFGVIDGENLVMDNIKSRVKAVKWFIDSVLENWNQSGFNHLELEGFYYNEEHTRNEGDSIIPLISEYIHEKEKRFHWIPYYGGQGARDWKKLGFDIAYQQPNYFFVKSTESNIPVTRLNNTAHFASKYGMALEFEFDKNIKDTLYQRKFNEYFDVFEKELIFKISPIAYYEGGGTWHEMSVSKNDTIRSLYEKLSLKILERQEKLNKYK